METPSPYSVAPVPKNEMARLRELDRYKVLDTPPEKKYDGITKAASLICSAPIALISLIDANRQWFKSKTGLDVSETPRDISFCQFAIQGQEILIVEDTSKDERFQKNPLVSGSPFIKFYAGAPLLTPSGIAVGTLCVLDTVPRGLDSKQLEALRALADSVVAYMELEANTRELIHAQAITLDLQKAREQFFVNMNHEFRTPVHGILGMVDLLHQTETNQIQSEYLDSVKESGEHLIRLINDVIDFSKAESGALVLSSIEFNLIELLKEIGILAVKEAEKKKLTFSLNLPKDLERLEVRSDAGRIRQVISNMISNALKFTESGKIDFSLENLSISETHVRGTLRFQDTGIGIAQERIPDLFEAFSQLDSSNSRKYGGTGLVV